MPTVSKKQEKFMQAVANNPKFAKKVGVNQSIGQKFTKGKDMKKNYMYGGKVKKMMGGGKAMGTKTIPSKAMMGGMADRAGARAMASPEMKKRMEMAMMKVCLVFYTYSTQVIQHLLNIGLIEVKVIQVVIFL